ncbi:MAG TPA: hypothetical protein VFZ00_01760 [Solirubrobacter sp.]|nr:hypothetical protein [Solirubrobacter sp.]
MYNIDGPIGYAVCGGCGIAVQRRLLAGGHECGPERYARHQARRLHWKHNGFDDALRSWLATPAGRFAEYYARRKLRRAQPGEA